MKEFYHSRNLALARMLAEKGLDVYAADPLLSEDMVRSKGLRYIRPEESDLIFDPFELKFTIVGGD
ncbi:MAG: hypothetical protein A4E44_01317 [Methanosaeta sp. PtaB.Bin018]|nr:MAG: hypothetical protein A4E44_01317 [Methanosaeta sp. PtaB.Bin018]